MQASYLPGCAAFPGQPANVVVLCPDASRTFRTRESVNEAPHGLCNIIRIYR